MLKFGDNAGIPFCLKMIRLVLSGASVRLAQGEPCRFDFEIESALRSSSKGGQAWHQAREMNVRMH